MHQSNSTTGRAAWFTHGDDPLIGISPAKRHTEEEAQRTDRLVDVRPLPALRNQVQLIGTDCLRAEPVRRATEVAAA